MYGWSYKQTQKEHDLMDAQTTTRPATPGKREYSATHHCWTDTLHILPEGSWIKVHYSRKKVLLVGNSNWVHSEMSKKETIKHIRALTPPTVLWHVLTNIYITHEQYITTFLSSYYLMVNENYSFWTFNKNLN